MRRHPGRQEDRGHGRRAGPAGRAHCSIGPVALAACLHFDVSTPNFLIQEAFAEFDVPWRNELVGGWNPIRNGEFVLDDTPGLGLELDREAIARHPYVPNAFPSLWDRDWQTNFTQNSQSVVRCLE